jgi:ParB family transcriptional regulator, chromosome partitioning protein
MVDRRLGRGLDFFLSGGRGNTPPQTPPVAAPSSSPSTSSAAKPPAEEVVIAPVDQLRISPYQPRKHIGEAELKELAASIGSSGLLQPILARRIGDTLEIVAGERRWRAAQLAGLKQVPVLVRSITDHESAVFGMVENLQREDLNAIEKAQGFQVLMKQLGATQEDVAGRVGLDRSTVANFLRLLDLPAAVQEHVSRGTLSMGHARTLLALGDHETMVAAADDAIRNSLSVRALEAKVKDALEATKGRPAAGKAKSRPVWLNDLEESLVDSLGTPVAIRYGRKRSQIIIDCAGREEFERIYQKLKGS